MSPSSMYESPKGRQIRNINQHLIYQFYPAVKNVAVAGHNLVRANKYVSKANDAYTNALLSLSHTGKTAFDSRARIHADQLRKLALILQKIYAEHNKWIESLAKLNVIISQNNACEKERLKNIYASYLKKEKNIIKTLNKVQHTRFDMEDFYSDELSVAANQEMQRYQFFAERHDNLLRRHLEFSRFSVDVIDNENFLVVAPNELPNNNNIIEGNHYFSNSMIAEESDDSSENIENENGFNKVLLKRWKQNLQEQKHLNKLYEQAVQEQLEFDKINAAEKSKVKDNQKKKRKKSDDDLLEKAIITDVDKIKSIKKFHCRSSSQPDYLKELGKFNLIIYPEKSKSQFDLYNANEFSDKEKLFNDYDHKLSEYNQDSKNEQKINDINQLETKSLKNKILLTKAYSLNSLNEKKKLNRINSNDLVLTNQLTSTTCQKECNEEMKKKLLKKHLLLEYLNNKNEESQSKTICGSQIDKFMNEVKLSEIYQKFWQTQLEQQKQIKHENPVFQANSHPSSIGSVESSKRPSTSFENTPPLFLPFHYNKTLICTTAYQARGENQLSLQVGDSIMLVKCGTRGWVLGRSEDGLKQGWYPAKFLRLS